MFLCTLGPRSHFVSIYRKQYFVTPPVMRIAVRDASDALNGAGVRVESGVRGGDGVVTDFE